ncbi:MAG: sugar ABC transporter permease [Chloroflexi bacterium]|nr:sugar ABC transporter permease [Chloroflexota bacterium]
MQNTPSAGASAAAREVEAARQRQRRNRWLGEETRWGYIFLLPVLAYLAVFVVFPVVYAFYLSFHEWNMLSLTMKFVGLDNYQQLFQDQTFILSLVNTAIFTVGVIGSIVVLSLALALALDTKLKGINFFRGVYYTPAVTSVIVIAAVWTWIYEPNFGILNNLARMVGLPQLRWLSDTSMALPSVIITAVWRNVGYFGVIFLAGLQGIDTIYYEAAKVDGANAWERFRHVTIPLLMPTTFYVVVMGIISSFQVFGLIYAMTGGGPVNATSVIVYYLYKQAFVYFRMGYASATAYVLFAIIFALTLIQFRLLGRRIET